MKRLLLSSVLILAVLWLSLNSLRHAASAPLNQDQPRNKEASNPPTPTPPKPSHPKYPHPTESNQQSAYDKRGTQDQPLIIKSLETPESAQERAYKRAERDEESTNDRWVLIWTAVSALATSTTAVIAGITAGIAIFSLRAIRDQVEANRVAAKAAQDAADATTKTVKAMQDTAERQLRAYLFVGVEKCPNLSAPAAPEFRIFIKNAGQTPAHDVFHWTNMGILPFPLREEPPGPDPSSPMIKTVIAPGADFVAEHKGPPILTAKAIAAIQDGSQYRLYAWGQVLYRDIFGINRTTKFRFMHGGPDISPGTMHYCEEGNDAD
ncbi:MAG: hypothetical protein HRU82_03885 [Nitrospira sp.]|nr:MAG: hypothetical protein HRU82_03885 [Nitrospira sp.]